MQIIRFMSQEGAVCTGTAFDGSNASLLQGNIYDEYRDTGKIVKVHKLLPPVDPRAIFCIGLNYGLHARETGMPLPEYPVIFMKNPASVVGHLDPIVIPESCREKPEVDYEAELAVIIGKAAKNVSSENALEYVLGYTCANDVSARRWQKHGGGGQWIKGKSFDSFCPIGPVMVTRDEIDDPQNLTVESRLNGKIMQKSNTKDMIFPAAQLISFLSQSATLMPGTLILTGTPEGVGFTRNPPVYLMPGDEIEVDIGKIGTLKNPVIKE